MTVTTEAPTLDSHVDVRFTPTGTPLAVRHDGRIWAVAEEPVHWFTRDSWWETRQGAPVGVGNLVDIEHWRVQVRHTSDSPLRTFELRRYPLSDQWLLEASTDN
jgi:hypothetical protein